MDVSNSEHSFEDLDARTFYEVLLDVNRLFANSLENDIEETLNLLCRSLVSHFQLSLCWIARLEKRDLWAYPVVSAGPANDYVRGIRVTDREDLPEGNGPTGLAMRSGEVVRVEVSDDRFSPWRENALRFGLGGGISVPFYYSNGDRGVVNLYRTTGSSFPSQLAGLLDRLGEDLTVFLRHKYEHDLSRRLLGFQEAIGRLLREMLEFPDPDAVYSLITQILIEKTDAMGAWVSVPDGQYLRTVACKCRDDCSDLENDIWHFRPPVENDSSALAGSSASEGYRTGKHVIIRRDIGNQLSLLQQAYPSLEPVAVAGSWPISKGGSIVAVLVIVSDDLEYFTDTLDALIHQLIDGMRMALENFDRLSQSRQLTLLYQALLSEGDLLFTASNEREFLDQTCVGLIESGLFKTVWLARSDGKGSIERAAAAGENIYELNLLPGIARQNGVESVTMRCVRLNEDIYIPDYLGDPTNRYWVEIAERNNWRSSVSVPIKRWDYIWGALSVISDQVDGFSPGMIDLLRQIAQIVSHGLEEIDLKNELNAERDRQAWLATHDILTGLPNRRGLEDRIGEAIIRSSRHETILAVGMLDLDDFKALNDRFGHEAGDQILKDLAASLRESIRQTDLLARVGGDEFVVVIEDVRKFSDLSKVLRKLESAFSIPVVLPTGEAASVGGSLGLSLYASDHATPDTLLRQADQALYRLKSKKGARSHSWAFYAPNDPEGISVYPHLSMSQQGPSARSIYDTLLHSHGLRPFYQPIIDLESGRVVGAEALARLVSSSGAIYFPGEFIGELSFGDQKFLTLEMLTLVLEDIGRMQERGIDIWYSINVLPELLVSEFFIEELVQIFTSREVPASRITFEILEGGNFLSMEDAWQRLVSLKELGIDLAIDDIGSAYSSLLRLRDLPIDKIKLDQGFVRTLGHQPNGFHFLNAMSDLSKGLNIDFIAEGVETEEILDAVVTMEVPYGQGYAISPPLGIDSFLDWHSKYLAEREKFISAQRPLSILGLYANHIRLSFLHHLRMSSGLVSPSADECQMKSHLIRLGFGGSSLDTAHSDYHQALARFERAFSQKPNPHLREVEESREALRKAIFNAL